MCMCVCACLCVCVYVCVRVCGVGSFQLPKRGGTILNFGEFLCCLPRNWVRHWYPFFLSAFSHFKILLIWEVLILLKYIDIHFNFVVTYPLPLEFKYFSWSCNILNKVKQDKSMLRKYICQDSIWWNFKLHIKQES